MSNSIYRPKKATIEELTLIEDAIIKAEDTGDVRHAVSAIKKLFAAFKKHQHGTLDASAYPYIYTETNVLDIE